MEHIKPSGAPGCWGRQYQDGVEECMQCSFQEGCRNEMLYQVTRQPPAVRNYAPPVPPRLTLPPAPPSLSSTVVPLPPKPYFAPPVSSIPTPTRSTVPVPAVATQPTYYQQSTGHSLPNPGINNPMAHWQRPGAPAQPYYFTQYPGESTGTRLVKNAMLRALEAIFAELMQFFRHWTWPPSKR